VTFLYPVFATLLFAVFLQYLLWCLAVRSQNGGWVDLGWTLGMSSGALFLILFNPTPRTFLLATVVLLWALRLASHIYTDRLRGAKPEDGRYKALRSYWGKHADRNFFFFFQSQALLSGFFLVPPLVASLRPAPFPDLQDSLGLGIALGAIAGERLADRQLARFRANPANTGKVCRHGLWHYSRHPNYFFEFLHWTAYIVWAWGAPLHTLTWLGAFFMYLFLRYFTGIPHTERQSLKSRGEQYRQYQLTTSPFFPWIPRKPS